MSIRKRLSATTAGALVAVASPVALVAAGSPAQAACAEAFETRYSVSGTTVRMPFPSLPTFRNGPGGTLRVSKKTSGSVSYSVVAGAESEVGAVLAKAKVSISAGLTKTNGSEITNEYTRTITPGKYGNVRYVSYGKRVEWRKYYWNATCTSTVTLGRGTIKFPSNTEGWYYWETSS